MASVVASPVGLHCPDVAYEVLGQADAKDLKEGEQVRERPWGVGVKEWRQHAKPPQQYLEEGDAHKGPSHDDQVVLQPLLKLAHTAFGVDGALLLQLLGTHRCGAQSTLHHEPRLTPPWGLTPQRLPLALCYRPWLAGSFSARGSQHRHPLS